MLYKNLSGYFRDTYGQRLKKICIDGGFTCPNRDGKCGTGGCIFCGERGAGEHIDPSLKIREQVKAALAGAKESDLFVAYFQNFTNTYAPLEVLRKRYGEALTDDRIRVLSVGTRPDCIDEETADLLESYITDKREVWVELGLQTSSDKTAKAINRGYESDTFTRAMNILHGRGIKTVVHLIAGLPGENIEDFKESVRFTLRHRPFGIKLHSIYVMEGTRLAELYNKKLYTPPTLEEYIEWAAEALSIISDSAVIHRVTGDCPEGMLIAPKDVMTKMALIERIQKRHEEIVRKV